MNLENYLAVSGLPGIFKLVSSRNNGLLVEDIDTGKSKFCSVRKHQFTPLGTVAIYTNMDTTELSVVFQTMKDQLNDNPPISIKSPSPELFEYFEKILPDFDRDRVFISDIKKIIKWFNFLHDRNLLIEVPSVDEEE